MYIHFHFFRIFHLDFGFLYNADYGMEKFLLNARLEILNKQLFCIYKTKDMRKCQK